MEGRLSTQLRVSEHENGAVLLDIEGGHLFSVNLAGARIVALLRRGKTVAEIVEDIAQECGVSERQVQADMDRFVAALRTQGLLEE